MSLIKFAVPTESGRTLIDDMLNSVIQSNVSRILTIKWSNDVWSSPAGNRTWNVCAGEKATIVCCNGSFVQTNQTKNNDSLICREYKHTIKRIIFDSICIEPIWTWNGKRSTGCTIERTDWT
jgi:hypothetical protein